MRLAAVPDNPVEWAIARLNVAPRPLLETQFAYTLARVIMVATKLGVFEALAAGPATGSEVATRCGTSPVGTEKLLFALAGAGYVRAQDGGYALTPVSRKWLLRASRQSLADKLLLQFLEWDWLERAEDYVRTGEPLDLHSMTEGEQWNLYQRGMRAMAGALAGEAVRRMPVPKHASEMLDIGGSHGYYSVTLCRRHQGLRAVILDLPEAVVDVADPGGVRQVVAVQPAARVVRNLQVILGLLGDGLQLLLGEFGVVRQIGEDGVQPQPFADRHLEADPGGGVQQ
jgi:hypothetical protein